MSAGTRSTRRGAASRAPVDHSEAYQRFFGVPFSDRQLEPQPISDEQQAYFRQFLPPVEETNPLAAKERGRPAAADLLHLPRATDKRQAA